MSRELPSLEFIKETVREAWKETRTSGEPIKLGYLYEGISKLYGYPNWDTFSAILKRENK